MKKIIIFSALAISGLLSLSSCSDDFLDAKNKSNISADSYFSTANGFESLTATAYYKLRDVYSSPNLFCSGTDLYEKGRSNYPDVTLFDYTLTTGNKNVLELYKACYSGIQECNAVIHYSGTTSDSKATLRTEEASALKAYYYYILSQQFGGVPLSESYIEGVIDIPRSNIQDTYNYITDLLLPLVGDDSQLPENDLTGRVSKRFVYNLLAKTYLAEGWDLHTTSDADGANVTVTDVDCFKKAAAYADKAIGGQTPSLSFSDFWDVKNDNNNETIFSIQYTRGITGQDETVAGNGWDQNFSNYYNDNDGVRTRTKYTNSQFPASEKLIYLFEPGDSRYEGTFMRTQYWDYYNAYDATKAATDSVLYFFPAWYEDLSDTALINAVSGKQYNQTKTFSSSDPCVYITKVYNKRKKTWNVSTGSQSYATSRTGTGTSMQIRKFDDYTSTRNTTKDVSFHNIILAHLTETYLIAAEAYYMAGDEATSLARLNVVRNRAGASTLDSYASYVRHYSDGTANSYNNGSGISSVPSETGLNPIDVILDERARELAGEGYRWMDLRRTKRLISYNVKYNSAITSEDQMKGADGKFRWYRPIPIDDINLNKALSEDDQNPGYKSAAE